MLAYECHIYSGVRLGLEGLWGGGVEGFLLQNVNKYVNQSVVNLLFNGSCFIQNNSRNLVPKKLI